MRVPEPLRRLDDATVAALRRTGRWLGAPAVRLSGWERRHRLAGRVAAHPGLVGVLAGAVVLAGAGVHVARFPTRTEVIAVEPGPAEVGPVAGVDLERYIAQRHAQLADAVATRPEALARAIVSFERLVAVGQVPLPDEVDVEVLHLLLPGEQEPRQVPADGADEVVADLFAAGREALDTEVAELERLLAEDLGDPAFEEEFATQLDRLRELRDGTDEDAAVVFAAVVVAPHHTLAALRTAAPVRLVDPAGPPERTVGTRFVGVRPGDGVR